MASPEIIQWLLQQANATGSRSTTMQPLMWIAGILISGLIAGIYYTAPSWLLITLTCFLGAVILLFLITFVVFALKNPDALRSERFTLSKMAIEKNLIGDSEAGLTEIAEFQEAKLVSTPSTSKEVTK